MINYYDPDKYETIVKHETCAYHKANPGKVWAGCTCSGSVTMKPKSPPPPARETK